MIERQTGQLSNVERLLQQENGEVIRYVLGMRVDGVDYPTPDASHHPDDDLSTEEIRLVQFGSVYGIEALQWLEQYRKIHELPHNWVCFPRHMDIDDEPFNCFDFEALVSALPMYERSRRFIENKLTVIVGSPDSPREVMHLPIVDLHYAFLDPRNWVITQNGQVLLHVKIGKNRTHSLLLSAKQFAKLREKTKQANKST